MQSIQILSNLKQHPNAQNAKSMAKFGIKPALVLHISIPTLSKMAEEIERNHSTALELWDWGIRKARILASMIGEPRYSPTKGWVGR